jgi:hypothetical protein
MERGKGEAEIGRSVLSVVSSLVVFVVASLFAYLVVLLVFEGVILPAVIGLFCGCAAATVLGATDLLAQRTEWEPTGDQDDPDRDRRTRRVDW